MKAVQLMQCGNPEYLSIAEINAPTIKNATEIKVRLKAAGVNPIDAKLRSGLYQIAHFPVILGCDGAGIVEETGAKVKRFKKGDVVYFFHGGLKNKQGNYAEYHVLDERFVSMKATSQSFIEAAAAPLILLTAWESLFERAHLAKDQTIFINAGAGGVGHVAIQLAKHIGATVCTSVSNKEKATFVKALGADLVINYKEQNVVAEIMAWTDGAGVDVAMDNVGGAEIPAIFPALKHYGEMVTLLQPDSTIDWSEARFKNIRFSLEVMLSPSLFDLKEAQSHQTWILEQCAKLIDDGVLKIVVHKTLPLAQATTAHQLIESGHTMGKIVLTMD